VENIGVEPMTS